MTGRLIPPHIGGLSYADMRWMADDLGVAVRSCRLPKKVDGYYDDATQVILIDYRITYPQKRVALAHELVHWAHGDLLCDPKSDNKTERRARRESVQLLVNPLEYASTEQIYGCDAFRIAHELEVTVQAIDDFRHILADIPLTV